MGKVITSAGLNEFIETGKHDVIKDHQEPKLTQKPVEPVKVEAKAEPKLEEKEALIEADGDLMPEETLEQARMKIAKKHRELKAEKAAHQRTREERSENERMAETQFNERRLVESERDKLKREVEELRSRTPVQPVQELKPPDKADAKFQDEKGQFDWAKFTDAQAEYRVEKYKADQQQIENQRIQADIQAKVDERIKAAKEKYPDFVEVVGAQDRRDVPDYIMQYMRESEQGAEMVYYFANNREELTKIGKLSPILAIERLGKLSVRFEPKVEDKVPEKVEQADTAQAVRTSSAPPPITPISTNGAGTVNTDPSKMDPKQLRAFRKAEWEAKHRRG